MTMEQIKKRASQSAPLIALVLGIAVGTFNCGCQMLPSKAFVEGEYAAFDAITPLYRGYVIDDDSLTDDEKESRLRTVRAWRFSLDRNASAVNNE